MKRSLLSLAVLATFAAPAAAQPSSDNVMSKYLSRSFAALAKDLVAIVETMPEQDFGYRPTGVVTDVRTFGEIVSHLVLVNAFVCAMSDGKPDSTAKSGTKPPVDKPGLLALINETNARCTAYLSTLTDARLPEVITSGSGARQLKSTRGVAMMFAIAHSNEHYGNLVTYVRAKGLVPPPTPAQAGFLSPVTPPNP